MASRPISILYFSSFGGLQGGGQISLFHLVKDLDKSAFRPCVILPVEDILAESLRALHIEVSILELPRIIDFRIHRNLATFYKLRKLMKKYETDLIHSDGPRNTFYAGIVGKIRKIPLIWHVRASNRDRYDRLLYHLSSRIILVANSIRSRFDWIGLTNKMTTVYNGVDLSELQNHHNFSHIREQYHIHDQSLLIGAVGRIEYLKGQKYLVEACGRLRSKLKSFHLLLVGEIANSAYLKECSDTAARHKINDRVIFTGHLENVSEILNEIDIFVSPSLFEAFPRSVIEAMGAGKAAIVTDVGGCSEAVKDHISGFVVPTRNSKKLAEIIHMLGIDNELRLRIGRAARVRAEKMFGIEQNVHKTEQIYREVFRENLNAVS